MTAAPAPVAALGFRTVEGFQAAWNLGPRLKVDGLYGSATKAAAALSTKRHAQGLGDISAHFSAREFACKCGGKLKDCQRTLILRDLLQSLEALRAAAGPIPIVCGYRCPEHNADVAGSASQSQHMWGAAADITTALTFARVRDLHVFAGIGYKARSRLVTHVDRRDLSGHNTTKGAVKAPTWWTYPEGASS